MAGATVIVMLVDVVVTSVMRGARGVSVGSGVKGTPESMRKRVKAETRA